MKTVAFNPDRSPIEALFAKWVPLYIGQCHLDDKEAEKYQAPLADLEAEITDLPIASMADFYQQQTAGGMFGSLCVDVDREQRECIQAIAMAESAERESLMALIDRHMKVFNATQTFSQDTGRAAADDPEFLALSDRELELLNAVVAHPTVSVSNVILKGRYLAALQDVGGLGFEQAQDFVETFLAMGGETRG